MIESGEPRSSFRCGEPATADLGIFTSLQESFASPDAKPEPATESAVASPRGEPRKSQENPSSGVLRAVKEQLLRKIPDALPKLQPPSDPSSPSPIIGLGALLLLALSALALVLYVVRFLRRPHLP